MRWTLLVDPDGHPGWWQMALDEALLEEAARSGEGFVRLYRWAPFCLSFGRHEPALRRYDRARIDAGGLDVVRRPTGGRAVWHALELTYAVAAPADTLGGLAECHRAIHTSIARAVQSLGVEATLAPPGRPEDPGAGACFNSAAGGEVLVQGRKLVGSAQLRGAGAFLQHGSLLLEGDQGTVARYSRRPGGPDGAITLFEAAERVVSFSEGAAALASEFRTWGGTWTDPGRPFDSAPFIARHADRYRDPAWTWRR